jgi:hypothetical protein
VAIVQRWLPVDDRRVEFIDGFGTQCGWFERQLDVCRIMLHAAR